VLKKLPLLRVDHSGNCGVCTDSVAFDAEARFVCRLSGPTVWMAMKMYRLWFFIVLVFVGCGRGNPRDLYGYSGTVLFDGEPLSVGTLYLEPIEGQSVQSFSYIAAGKFQVADKDGVMPGRYRVIISNEGLSDVESNVESGGPVPEAGESEVASPKSGKKLTVRKLKSIPPDYNIKSKLEVEVAKNSENHFDFNLQSNPDRTILK